MTALLLAATSLPHLMPDGWGAVKIGMTQAQVGKALGAKLEGEPIEEGEVCVEMSSAAVSDMWFMFEEGKLTRISIGLSSKITTPRGIGLRTSVVQVRKAYGRRLEEKPHYYVGLPAQYLTLPDRSGRTWLALRDEHGAAGRNDPCRPGQHPVY